MRRLRSCGLGLLAALLLFALPIPAARAGGPLGRFGVDMVKRFGRIDDYDIAPLRIAWYSDWTMTANPARPGGIEYVQLILTPLGQTPALSLVGEAVDANPGALWLIGNEPECIYQDNSTPEQYAEAYHRLYTYIKGRDAKAQVATGGIVQPTPLRLEWLDRVLAHYQATYGEAMPVDVWNIHNLILQERKGDWGCDIPNGLSETEGRLYGIQDNDNIEIFKQHIVDMRVWMRDHGYRDKPLIVSEYGVLMPTEYYGFTPERVNAFMSASFDYLLSARDEDLGCPADGNRLVQRWAWNSLNEQPYNLDTGEGFNGALFDYQTRQITPAGTNYRQYTSALAAGQTCLTARIDLQGRPARPAASYAITATVRLTPAAGGPAIVRTVRSDASGHLGVCNLAPGTYDLEVKGYNTLAARVAGVQVTADSPILDLGLLRAGDATGDGCIDILDFTVLTSAYGRAAGAAGFDPRADFNGDGQVSTLDFSLLAGNYGRCSTP